MKTLNKYVGLDVHKDTTVMAIAEEGRAGEVRLYGTISSDLHALEKALRKIGGAISDDATASPAHFKPETILFLFRAHESKGR